MQTPAGGDLLVTNPPAILPCSLPQRDPDLPQRWGWGWASTSPAAGPPRDHHGTITGPQQQIGPVHPISAICLPRLGLAPWLSTSHWHGPSEPWASGQWPQNILAAGTAPCQEGEQAGDIGMGAACSTRVPEPCATARGCDTPRAPREKTPDTPGPPLNATAPNPAGSGEQPCHGRTQLVAISARRLATPSRALHSYKSSMVQPPGRESRRMGTPPRPAGDQPTSPPPAAATTGTRGLGTPAPGASAAPAPTRSVGCSDEKNLT